MAGVWVGLGRSKGLCWLVTAARAFVDGEALLLKKKKTLFDSPLLLVVVLLESVIKLHLSACVCAALDCTHREISACHSSKYTHTLVRLDYFACWHNMDKYESKQPQMSKNT